MGLAVSADGALYVSDDMNHAVYRIAYGASALEALASPAPVVVIDTPAEIEARCRVLEGASGEFAGLERLVIDEHCVPCHAGSAGGFTLRRCDANGNHAAILNGTSAVYGRYLVAGDPEQGYLMARLHGDSMGPRMPPQGIVLTSDEIAAFDAWVRHGAP